MKKLLAIAILLAGTMVLVSCGDDEDPVATFDQPTVTAGSAGDLANGASGTVDFTVTLDADLTSEASWTLTSSGVSSATIGGETSGTTTGGPVTVDIAAGTTAGVAQIRLTVTNPSQDPQGGSASDVAVFSVLEAGDEPIAISGIPTDAAIDFGGDLNDVPYTVAGADGIASFMVSVNDAAAIDFAAVTGDDLSAAPAQITGTFSLDWATLQSLGVAPGNNSFVFTATDADGDTDEFTHILNVADIQTVTVNSNITENTTWTANNVYVLAARVTVLSGVTLTIEPGTVIKGGTGQGTSSKALLVARGATLDAQGTAAAPIIFTSTLDNIQPGQIESPNLTIADRGLWGGVILLGDAPISVSSDGVNESEAQVEGIPSTDTNGLYGGTDGTDNAGTLSYLSIRHAGTDIGDGDEIQGLTLGGVGSGTSISWIEIVASDDDGIEFFGGSVDVNGVLIWSSTDDALDTDMDYQGAVSNFIIVAPAGGSAFELDGPEGVDDVKVNGAGGFHSFDNGTVYAGSNIDHLVDKDGDTNAQLTNIYFYGLDASYGPLADEDPDEAGDQPFEPIESLAGDGTGTSATWQVTSNGMSIADVFGDAAGITSEVAVNANTVGPTSDAGFEWTFASVSGALAAIGL